ncbi:hypothetical protein [Methylopila sp. 73B]|uniref:hypothetical protein n=1 Tax=Methylopila sp. 73B TaxID=1120792 RepID=UPI00036F4B08|nr:hypothetical protein [Methylopila sp. 73B]
MNSAPITTWEGAKAYFTFADQPGVLMVISALALAVCVGTIASMIRHENACVRKANGA